jgi:hypothetical protein
VNGRHARKLRKLSKFKPNDKRYYQQFDNSHNYKIGKTGELERGPGTVIEVTKDGEAETSRAIYKLMKEKYYGTF